MTKKFLLLTFICLTLAFSACTNSSSSDSKSDGGDNSGGGDTGGLTDEEHIRTDCGTVFDGKLTNPVAIADGQKVYLTQVFTADRVAIRSQDGLSQGDVLVKIQGVGTGLEKKARAAQNKISEFGFGSLYFYKANKDCSFAFSDGGSGTVGQLLTADGRSVGEELVKAGLVDVDTSDTCGASQLGTCYNALTGTAELTAGELTAFLWKPTSDNTGTLAIHTGPYGTDVYVNGEKGSNSGPGNGFGSLARFSKGGCAYANPQIQVIDSLSGLAYTIGGKSTFTLTDPCGRHCLEGGAIVACVKN